MGELMRQSIRIRYAGELRSDWRERVGNFSPGMSLVELIITMSLMIMLTSALLWMIITAKTMYQASVASGANRQDLQVITWSIAEDLRASNVNSITVSGGTPPAFSFLSALGPAGSFEIYNDAVHDIYGAPYWQKYVIYYIPSGTTRLLRKEIYSSAGLYNAQPLTQTELLGYCTGDGKLVSPSVTALGLSPSVANSSALLSATVQNQNQHGKINTQSSQMSIFLDN